MAVTAHFEARRAGAVAGRARAPAGRREGRARFHSLKGILLASHIEDYALLGDCETAALVSKDGSIDWLCWPRFDSDACFAALLGTPDNGCWRIAPCDGAARITRAYRGDTLILETRIETDKGSAVLIERSEEHTSELQSLMR